MDWISNHAYWVLIPSMIVLFFGVRFLTYFKNFSSNLYEIEKTLPDGSKETHIIDMPPGPIEWTDGTHYTTYKSLWEEPPLRMTLMIGAIRLVTFGAAVGALLSISALVYS